MFDPPSFQRVLLGIVVIALSTSPLGVSDAVNASTSDVNPGTDSALSEVAAPPGSLGASDAIDALSAVADATDDLATDALNTGVEMTEAGSELRYETHTGSSVEIDLADDPQVHLDSAHGELTSANRY